MAEHDREVLGPVNDDDDMTRAVWDDDQQHGASRGDLQPTQTELADGVDASTTRLDVQKQARDVGISATLRRGLPKELASSATGGGAVSTGGKGAALNPGTTSGDTCNLHGPKLTWLDGLDRTFYRITVNTEGSATGDSGFVGHFKNPFGSASGWYVETHSGDLVSIDGGTENERISSANNSYSPNGTVIDVYEHRDTAVYVEFHGPGGYSSHTLAPPSNFNPGDVAAMESAGNGDRMIVASYAWTNYHNTEDLTDQ